MTTVIRTVFIVWVHDMILDIYASAQGASESMSDYRRANPGKWRRVTAGKWMCSDRGTRITLEVEIRPVEP